VTGEPLVLPSIIPAWCRAIVDPDVELPDDPNDIPVRFALVTPNGPGAWVDTTLSEAEGLAEKLMVDLAAIRKAAERG
jgi:hypothetical protein